MKRIILQLILIVSAFADISARHLDEQQTDSLVKSRQVIQFGKAPDFPIDTVDNILRRFYLDQFRHFQDPLAPYFLFLSKDSNLAMGIGGAVRMRGYFDWGGAIPIPGFTPYMIPMTPDPVKMRQFGTTPAGTCLYFRVIGRNKTLGEYQLYIEANFNGYQSRDFLLKKAYAVINDWTIGYAPSTFSDPMALPPTVDAQGPNVKISPTNVLVRYMRNFRAGWSVAASVETPSTQHDTDGKTTEKVTPYIPDIAFFGQYMWGQSHIRLAAIVRSLPYRDLVAQKNRYPVGFGVQLSTISYIGDRFTFYGAVNGGKGYASLGGDWLMGKYDLVPEEGNPGRLYAPLTYGGYAAVKYNFRPNLFTSLTGGFARYEPNGEPEPTEYRRGLYFAANVFWNLTPRIQVGAEFNLGQRQDFSHDTRWARRVGALAMFSF